MIATIREQKLIIHGIYCIYFPSYNVSKARFSMMLSSAVCNVSATFVNCVLVTALLAVEVSRKDNFKSVCDCRRCADDDLGHAVSFLIAEFPV